MKRRHFLTGLATLPAVSTVTPAFAKQSGKALKIRDLEFWHLQGKRKPTEGLFNWHHVTPGDIYMPPLARVEKVKQGKEPSYGALYLKILTDQGVEGNYGPIDWEAARVVVHQLKNGLIGMNPLAGERIWDVLFRQNRHSRAGHYMMAISAVDNALWDLRGQYFAVPVYRLLGGPTRDKVEVYGSCLAYSVEPEAAAKKALEVKKLGYKRQKWFPDYGPADGPEGMSHNVELVRKLREVLGESYDIMFDAFSGWDLNYALEWAEKVEDYHPAWIEEAFHPEKLDSFVQLSRSTSIPVATGEHFYNRWEVMRFLKAGAIQVVQADPEWCGGVSELVKMCAIASAFDARVVPHGHNLHAALHVVASQSPMTCPYGEYLINKMDHYYLFEKADLTPKNGFITLPDKPGFGIEFDESRIERMEKIEM